VWGALGGNLLSQDGKAPSFDSIEEGKTELGMAHYEVRKYPGWHHHMLTTMLAHFFLWHLKLRLGKKSAGPHRVAASDLIGHRLTPADGDY